MIVDYGSVRVRKAILADAAKLAPNLRQADLQEIAALSNRPPKEALEAGIRAGNSYTLVLASGEIAAVFGTAPTADPKLGAVWLLASDAILKIRFTFLRHSRTWLNILFAEHALLGNFVDARNALHISWLRWLGFRFLRRTPLGLHGEEFFEFVRLKETHDSSK